MKRRPFLRAAACAPALALPLLAASRARAQPQGAPSNWPERPVKLLVGFPPGQATDAVARVWAERMHQRLRQPVVVDNRPGQGGSIALTTLANAPADGYTLMLSATASLVVNPHLYRSVGYDTLKDFEAIGTLVNLPMVLVTHPSVEADSVAALLALAKARPSQLRYASSGNGTLSHLGMEIIKQQAGVEAIHVPYQGSARSMTDLIAGTVELALDTLTVTLPHIQSGRLKPLAVSTDARLAALPSVPTLAEAGLAPAAYSPWLGLIAPRGTPAAVLTRLSDETLSFVSDHAVAQRLQAAGAVPRPGDRAALTAIITREYASWGKVVRASGLSAD